MEPSLSDDTTAIHYFSEDYSRAFASGDPDVVQALVTEDFVALTPGKPVIQGREALRQEVSQDLESMRIERLTFTHEEVVVEGDWAHAWGRSEAQVVAGDDPMEIRGKYLWILRKQPDGRWLLARDSSNGDEE